MELLETAGMPPGVINPSPVTASMPKVALSDPDLAGIHRRGSTATFQHLWQEVGANLPSYRDLPIRSARPAARTSSWRTPWRTRTLRTAMIRGAFEYQGQKCSAASRAYVPRSVWRKIKADLASITDGLTQGDVTDLSNFMGAVIDEKAFAKHAAAIDRAHSAAGVEVVAGGKYDDSEGYFVRPPPSSRSTTPATSPSGPSTSARSCRCTSTRTGSSTRCWTRMESFAPYGLTGSIIAQDRHAIADATSRPASPPATSTSTTSRPAPSWGSSRSAAGAPRAPTTSRRRRAEPPALTSARSIKETFNPPTNHAYPHMG